MMKTFAVAAFAALQGMQSGGAGVEQVGWMAGCWVAKTERADVHERWTRPAAGMMLGTSQTIADGRTVEYEFIRLHAPDGVLTYTANPSRQAEASFTATSVSAREAVFENPAHDFPQKISYRLQKDGSMTARVEGTRNGTARAVEFPYKRISCE